MIQESERVELKREYTEGIRKDVIAFANSEGGVIYVGIADNGQAVGVASPDQTIQRVANMVRDSIRPDVTMFLRYDTVELSGAPVVRITVSRGTGRPYYHTARGLQPSGVYVRQGTAAAPASESAIREMIRETDGASYEERRSLEQALTFEYASARFEEKGLAFGAAQRQTLGLVSADGVYTNLGLLISDQCPHTIKAAAFAGEDQTVFQDRREFGGSLLRQLDDAYAFLDLRNERSATFDGLRRTDHRAYPEAPLREALLNAVTHRDYAISASTLISCYADRVEIVSAGGLVRDFTLNDVMLGLSVCRNPRLANIFYRLGLIEAYGTGLPKITNAYPGFTPEQLFQVTPHAFRVTLPRRPAVGPGEQDEDKVLFCLRQKGSISRAEVQRLTGLSTPSASRLLRRMVDGGLLVRTGQGVRTRYQLPRP